MSIQKIAISLGALGALFGANALPSPQASTYAVKERHHVPRSWKPVGAADKSETINLQIGLKQSNEGTVERHLMEVSDPAHARYGNHLTAAEIADIIRPADDTISMVHAWLREHGIENLDVAPAKDWISIVVPIEKAEQLLQTSYSKYKHVNGDTVNRAPEWSLPLQLHEHIDVVQPTTSFMSPRAQFKPWGPKIEGPPQSLTWWEHTGKHQYGPKPVQGTNLTAQIAAVCNASFVTPDCIRTAYQTINYTVQAANKNSIAVNNYLNETQRRDDAKQFLQLYRPEAVAGADDFKIVIIDGAENYQGPNISRVIAEDHDVEGNLDGQQVLSISWPTPFTAYSTGGSPPFNPDITTPTDTNEPYLAFLNYALAQPKLPYVFSSSYGDDEQTVPESYARRACAGFAQLGARGITYFVSSGDSGVGGDGECYSNDGKNTPEFLPAFPTSCPWVTSVGGTKNFNPEVAVTRFASGAGFSNYFPQPAYQASTVNAYVASLNGLHDGLYNKSGRAYPDVAAQGNYDVVVWAQKIVRVGGTSASSPTFAGVISLVNDALLAAGKKPLGFINPWLYSKAYKTFTDVTIGSSFGCNTTGFPAATGWDAVTGFGTPNFPKLVQAAFQNQGGNWHGPGGW
ncbi:hypothetical protein LTR95_002775 [Oleoguttula sp. CCFEE 5521]